MIRTAAPRRADGAADFLHPGDLLHRRHIVLTQLGYQARPQLGRVALDVVPPRDAEERIRVGEDQRPRSLQSCCRENNGRKSAVIKTEKNGPSEADGVHDGLDLGRSIIERANVRDRVRQPDPGLVEHYDATERGELVEERLEFGHGPEQLDVADERPDEDELDGPVAEHLIRQAEIAAGCVRRFRHGMSVLRPGASPSVSTASRPGYDNAAISALLGTLPGADRPGRCAVAASRGIGRTSRCAVSPRLLLQPF